MARPELLERYKALPLPTTSEEAWRHLGGAHAESVHLERFPEVPLPWLDDALKRDWDRLLEVRREVARQPREPAPTRRHGPPSQGEQ